MHSVSSYLRALNEGQLDERLHELYGPGPLSVQRQRYQGLLKRMERFSPKHRVLLISVPGRTELGGNHTDHNHGVVLAAGVHVDCLAVAGPNDAGNVRIRSEGFSEQIEVDLDDLEPRAEEYGTARALLRGVLHGFVSRGWKVAGFDACVGGDVPVGSGLSSSAAFEVCLGQVLNQLFNSGERTALELATVAREAENIHFGKPCGFMDQLSCAAQGILSIDFQDAVNPAVIEIDFDFNAAGYQLMVVNTGGDHADLTPEYAAIPDEMKRAARVLGQTTARGLTVDEVLGHAKELRREAGDRALLRLIHFIEESDRAIDQAAALKAGEMDRFLSLVNASGDSSWRLLQNCISTTNYLDQPIPVALTLTERYLDGQGAWRIQGGGFAGTIQAYVPVDGVKGYAEYMESVFGKGAVLALNIRKPGLDAIRLG